MSGPRERDDKPKLERYDGSDISSLAKEERWGAKLLEYGVR